MRLYILYHPLSTEGEERVVKRSDDRVSRLCAMYHLLLLFQIGGGGFV
jgi:hypothetical protein